MEIKKTEKLHDNDFVVLALTGAEVKLLESALVILSEDGTQTFGGLDERLQHSINKTLTILSPIVENGVGSETDEFEIITGEPVAFNKITGYYHWLDEGAEISRSGYATVDEARTIAFAYSESAGGEPSEEVAAILRTGVPYESPNSSKDTSFSV